MKRQIVAEVRKLRTTRTVWGLLAGLVALVAGVIWGSKLGVQFSIAFVALKALPVLMLGGLTSVPGAIVGGLLLGVVDNFVAAYWSAQYRAALPLFLLIAVISIYPTLAFIRWRRALDHDAAWTVPPEEHARYRKLVMAEVHLAALIPAFAVIMSRGLGH